jgi:hypothetical protein
MSENQSVGFNWVHARSECGLPRVFQILSEVIGSDVKAANALNRRGVKFQFTTEAAGKILAVRDRDFGGFNEIMVIVIELASGKITVSRRVPNKASDEPLFYAVPGLNEEGECLLEVDGKSLKLWQVSRKALDDLFFGF